MSSRFAAIYIDAQLSSALSLLARGEPNDQVKKILTVAFSMLDDHGAGSGLAHG